MPQQSDLLAVLVDADNVSPSRIGGVLAEIATYGTASVKRVYGDWTKSQLRGWKDAASEHVIQPMQQFDNTTGKNATDSALIIDAMDLLYTRRFQGFCIVSSDSDFTRLASRIREEGVTVYGFGERKTPEAFRNACDQFTYLEVLGAADEPDTAPSARPSRMSPAALRADPKLVSLLRSSVETASSEDGWADLGTVGQLMRKQQPDFDSRNWGYAKLSDLLKAVGLFAIESKPGGMSLRPKTLPKASGSDGQGAGAGADVPAADAMADAAAPAARSAKRPAKKRSSTRGGAPADGDAPVTESSEPAEQAAPETVDAPDAAAVAATSPARSRRKAAPRAKASGAGDAPDTVATGESASTDATLASGSDVASSPVAESGTVARGGSGRGRTARPIEQLTLETALDAALDAVSNAARASGQVAPGADSAAAPAEVEVPAAAAAPATTTEAPVTGEDDATDQVETPAKPKRAPRSRAKKAAASEPADTAAPEPAAPDASAPEPAAPDTAASEPAAPDTAASDAAASRPAATKPRSSRSRTTKPAASKPAASEPAVSEQAASEQAAAQPAAPESESAAPARKRAPRRASRPGTTAS